MEQADAGLGARRDVSDHLTEGPFRSFPSSCPATLSTGATAPHPRLPTRLPGDPLGPPLPLAIELPILEPLSLPDPVAPLPARSWQEPTPALGQAFQTASPYIYLLFR